MQQADILGLLTEAGIDLVGLLLTDDPVSNQFGQELGHARELASSGEGFAVEL